MELNKRKFFRPYIKTKEQEVVLGILVADLIFALGLSPGGGYLHLLLALAMIMWVLVVTGIMYRKDFNKEYKVYRRRLLDTLGFKESNSIVDV